MKVAVIDWDVAGWTVGFFKFRRECYDSKKVVVTELGPRSFFRGSLSAPHSIFSPGSLTLLRSFFELPFSLVAQTLVAQPVVR